MFLIKLVKKCLWGFNLKTSMDVYQIYQIGQWYHPNISHSQPDKPVTQNKYIVWLAQQLSIYILQPR